MPESSLNVDLQPRVVVPSKILEGRDLMAAYRDMADRRGIDATNCFVNLVSQTVRFGPSMTNTLLSYSAEMRQKQEMRAQEKANCLPVMMSADMAGSDDACKS